jgi:hypothetical protein
MQYVTEPGRALQLAIRGHAHGKVVAGPFLVSYQLLAWPVFYRDMSICVVEEARPHPKRFAAQIFLREAPRRTAPPRDAP